MYILNSYMNIYILNSRFFQKTESRKNNVWNAEFFFIYLLSLSFPSTLPFLSLLVFFLSLPFSSPFSLSLPSLFLPFPSPSLPLPSLLFCFLVIYTAVHTYSICSFWMARHESYFYSCPAHNESWQSTDAFKSKLLTKLYCCPDAERTHGITFAIVMC